MLEPTRAGAVAVLLATGTATQVGDDETEVSRQLAGRRMVTWTLASLMQVPEVVRTVLVTRTEDILGAEAVRQDFPDLDIETIEGTTSRHDSVHKALQHLADDIRSGTVDVVLVHDAARPLCRPGMMQTAISIARADGGAVPALDGRHLMHVASDGSIVPPEPDQRYMRVQTPQAFRASPLFRAYGEAARIGFEDEDPYASVQRFSDLDVRFFDGEERNLRVVSADDMFLAERLLTKERS